MRRCQKVWRGGILLAGSLVLGFFPGATDADDQGRTVTALGRLEPRDGVVRVAGPSRSAVVIAELLVEEGQVVEKGDSIAVLDSFALNKAEVARLAAERDNAQREFDRAGKLFRDGVSSDSTRDEAKLALKVAGARLAGAQAEFDRSTVRAPIAGQVIEVHAHTGERVDSDGIVELGRTSEMYAVAEVYETDIGLVKVGQRATIRSPALAEPVQGTVERIGLKVGKLDILDIDPASRTDARVVEVDIRLDEGHGASGLTNLQVEVEVIAEL